MSHFENNSGSGSDTNSGNDSESETHVEVQVGSGAEVGSGDTNTSSRSVNVGSQGANPPRIMAEYAKGTYDPKKPLLVYVTKVGASVPQSTAKRGGGSRHWTCNVCGHHWVGSYSRIKQHLLGIGGKGVNVCTKLSMQQRSDLLRLQMAADTKGTFSSHNVEALEGGSNSKRKSRISIKASNLMPPPSPATTSSSKKGSSRSCAIGPTISGMYGRLNRDDTDDAIGKFLFANGIPFHVSRSPYYKEMVQAIAASGPSYVPPGEHKLRTVVLDRQVSNITMQKENMRLIWVKKGCSIVMDWWTDIYKRPLINIIVITCQ